MRRVATIEGCSTDSTRTQKAVIRLLSPKTPTAALMVVIGLLSDMSLSASDILPVGSHPAAITSPHFPNEMHAFIWRNWQFVETNKMAAVLGTSSENVTKIATSMGLPDAPAMVDVRCVEQHSLHKQMIN